jgi:membrane-associated phospholipid phosphatase
MHKTFSFFFILTFLSCQITHSQNADINLLRKINLNRNRSLDPALKFVSNTVLPLSIAVPVGTITYALIRKDSASKSQAIIFTSSVVLTEVLVFTLKYSINRERPYLKYPDLDNAVTENDPAFPSGHTSAAFALATAASINYPKWYVIAPSFLYAVAVGYSRLALGVHYPSDVFMGALIGSGSAFLSYKLNHWLFEKKSSKRNITSDKRK